MQTPHTHTTALIFGGSQGLGLAIAEQMRDEGCTRMVIVGRDQAKGEAAATRLGAHFLACDLADVAQVTACVDRAAERMGSITALCLSAASTERGSILDTTPADFDRMFAINTKGPFFAIQRVAQLARAAGHPASIVTILSMSAHVGQSFLAPYAASKAALSNITKNTANALRHDRIRANGINCGWMDTPGEDAIQRGFHNAPADWLAQAEAAQPFGMLVKPLHVAGLASFMLGPQSGVMTGAIVDFDQNVSGASPE